MHYFGSQITSLKSSLKIEQMSSNTDLIFNTVDQEHHKSMLVLFKDFFFSLLYTFEKYEKKFV